MNATGRLSTAGPEAAGLPGGEVGAGPLVPPPAGPQPRGADSPTRPLSPRGPGDPDARDWGLPGAEPGPPGAEPGPPRRRRSRRRRILLILLAVLVVGLGVMDRVAARVAASQMESQIQKSLQVPSRPEASVGGVPFLTQIVSGKYSDIGVSIRRIAVPDLCVDDIDVHLEGVHVPLRRVIGNDLEEVSVDRVAGSVRLTFADLNAYLATQPGNVQVASAGTGMRVSAPVDVPIIGEIRVFGDVQASVQNNRLMIAPAGIGVEGLGSLSVPQGAVQALTVTVPLSGLPLNLQLISAKATRAGIEVTAEAENLTLDTAQTTTPQIRGC